VALLVVPQLWDGAGPLSFFLLLAGGLSYTAGAVVYALRRPDPWPATFGFHEVFHALTVVAASLHYTAIAIVVI
jgi:hemolysin III